MSTATQQNIQQIAHRMAPGKFTKQAATEAKQVAEKLFAALPQSKQLSFIGYLNAIYLFLEAAERNMAEETSP